MPNRPPLSPERIIEAAVEVADAGGLAAVSMRNVGRQLGVEAMSLYHHLSDKDALLDGLVEWIFARFEPPGMDLDWREGMTARAHSARAILTDHPWALGLIESRRNPGPTILRYHDQVLGCLRRGGFSVALAAHAFSVTDAYVFGFVLTEVNLPIATGSDAETMAAEMALAEAAYPHLVEMMSDMIVGHDYTYGRAEFDYGLELILDGLERRLAESHRA